jgi:hypothetical protein
MRMSRFIDESEVIVSCKGRFSSNHTGVLVRLLNRKLMGGALWAAVWGGRR